MKEAEGKRGLNAVLASDCPVDCYCSGGGGEADQREGRGADVWYLEGHSMEWSHAGTDNRGEAQR